MVLYSNKHKNDILLKDDLEEFTKINKNLKIYHTLTRHNEERDGEWNGFKGHVSAEMIKQCKFPEPSPETLIGMCGPSGLTKTCEDILKKLGYEKDMIHKF